MSEQGIERTMLKLELGKKYITRNGAWTAGPIEKNTSHDNMPYKAKFFNIETGKECDEIVYRHQGHYWVFNDDGYFCNPVEHEYDLVSEYTEEAKVFKIEAGKRYITRSGKITQPVQVDPIRNQPFMAKIGGDTKWYSPNGYWLNERDQSEHDLVEEFVEGNSKLTLPLKFDKKYVTRDGTIVEMTDDFSVDDALFYARGDQYSGYYIIENGRYNGNYKNDPMYPGHIVADYIEPDTKAEAPRAVKKNPIKYSNLKFYEAWELAKETKKRYRFKGQDWIEFPNVSVTKDTFNKEEWELERG
jgi:hypothetical protein